MLTLGLLVDSKGLLRELFVQTLGPSGSAQGTLGKLHAPGTTLAGQLAVLVAALHLTSRFQGVDTQGCAALDNLPLGIMSRFSLGRGR